MKHWISDTQLQYSNIASCITTIRSNSYNACSLYIARDLVPICIAIIISSHSPGHSVWITNKLLAYTYRSLPWNLVMHARGLQVLCHIHYIVLAIFAMLATSDLHAHIVANCVHVSYNIARLLHVLVWVQIPFTELAQIQWLGVPQVRGIPARMHARIKEQWIMTTYLLVVSGMKVIY